MLNRDKEFLLLCIFIIASTKNLTNEEAKLILEKIWVPNEVWHNFIEQVLQSLTVTTEILLN